MAYQDRNPVWLCGGVEVDSPKGKVIKWSEPEIVMYDDDPYVRMSYPDLIEEDGKYYLSETQKEVARVHEVDTSLLEGLWGQFENKTIAKEGCVLDLGKNVVTEVAMPTLPDFSKRSAEPPYGLEDLRPGFALDVWFELAYLDGGQVLLDARLDNGQGICLITTDRGTVEVVLNDGRTECRWDCDPDVIEEGKLHHLVAIVDGGPKVITFVVDGVLCDGGSHRQFGWGRFSPHLYHVNGSKTLRVGLDVKALRIYDRYLRTSEAIGNFQAGI